MSATPQLLAELRATVGDDHLLTRPADVAAYAYDAFGASGERHLPSAVVFPRSTTEVAAVVRACAEEGVPVVARGAGTGYSGGSVSDSGVIVCTVRMDSVLGLDTSRRTIRVQAGVLTATVHERAAAAGLYYPPDPGASATSTIGGNIACNAAGARTLRYGTTGDFVAGLTAVLADGRIVDVESGSGNDLMGLLIGSEGTLGIVTEATLRLIAQPQARITLSATFNDVAGAANAVTAIAEAGVMPSALEFVDRAGIAAVARSGYADVNTSVGAFLIVEYEGDAGDVENTKPSLITALTKAKAQHIKVAEDPRHVAHLWRVRKSISAAVAAVRIGKVNEDVVVPRHHLAQVVDRARAVAEKHDLPLVTFGHAGDGNVHVTLLIDPRIAGERAEAEAAMAEIFDFVLEHGGSITGEHGVGTSKLRYSSKQLGDDGVSIMRSVKDALDPGHVLNPGKKIPV